MDAMQLIDSATDTQTERSDTEYVQECRNGNPEDFRFLVQRYQRLLFAFLLDRVSGDRSLAEDAAQESLLRAFRGLPKLKKPDAFQAWLLGIAGRVAHEFNRAKNRTPEMGGSVLDLAAIPDPPQPTDDLEEAVAALPELHRRLILLRYYEGLSCQETADRLNMPLGSVTKTLSRAYAELRELLKLQEQITTPQNQPL